MASRGRGRGQGQSSYNKKSGQERKIPKSIDELAKYLHSLDEKNLEIYGAEFANMVCGYAENEAKLFEVVELVFDTTVADQEYSVLGSRVCDFIVDRSSTDSGSIVSSFLHTLLEHLHSKLKNMKEMRCVSIESWLGVFAFLCEIYHRIRVGGQPLKVLGKSIRQIIDTMLKDSDTIDEEIDTVCTKLKVCGKSLEDEDPPMMENILCMFRQQVIQGKCSCRRRCLIMELIELKQLGWTDKSGNLGKFYADALADAVVEDEVG